MALLAMIAEDMGGLRPQRTEAFFPAFAEEPDLKRSYQLQIASPQIDDLLHARSCVEHGGQKDVVAAAISTGAADSSKDSFDFSAFEIFDNALTGAFEGDAQNALNPVEVFGMIRSHVAKKGVDSSQADVSGGHAILADLLQMAKESNHVVRFNVPKIQVVNTTLSLSSQETKKQHQAVTIAVNGVGAHAANSRQMVGKVLPQAKGELVRCCDLHARFSSCRDSGTTSPPYESWKRLLARARRDSTKCK